MWLKVNLYNKTLLLVEDEPINARLNKRILEKYCYKVIHSKTGEEAVDVFKSIPGIDLILMDIDLGDGIDGTEAAEIILKDHDIPLVFLSSHTEPEVVKKTEDITSYGYILKNSGETVLIASIKMAFRLFHARRVEVEKEKKLKESEERYRSIFENTGTSMFLVEEDMTIVMVNNEFVRCFGYSKEEVIGKMKWVEVVHPDSVDFMIRQHRIRRFNENAALSGYECQYLTKKGEIRNGFITVAMIPGSSSSIASITDLTELKRAESALHERNEELAAMNEEFEAANEELIQTIRQLEQRDYEYRLLFETSAAGIFILSENKVCVFNKAVAELTGYTDEQILSRPLISFIHHDDVNDVLEHYRRIVKQKVVESSSPVRIITSDNGVKWIGLKSSFIIWDGQKSTLNFISDITERKMAEDTLRFNESKYRKMFENIQHVFYQTDIDGIIIEISPSILNYCGYTREELIGTPIANVYFDLSERGAFVQTLMKNGRVLDYEIHLKNRENRVMTTSVSSHLLYDSFGKPVAIEGTVHDITRIKNSEEALKVGKDRLAGVIKGTNAGTWEWNIQTGELLVNDRWAEMIGYTLEEVQPVSINTWIKYLHPDDLIRSNELLRKHFMGKVDYYEQELRMKHKNGNWVWILDRGKITNWTPDGRPEWMMGTHQDITKNKEAEEKIIQINRAKSMYLARLSHEIRTPLSAMIGMLDLAIITENETERDDYLVNARQSSSHLISLINDVLDYSKIEAGALELESVPFNPFRELNSVIFIFKQVCSNKKISLDIIENLKIKYKVYGDPTRFRQVLINLVGNAVKFTEYGGIKIEAGFFFDSNTLNNSNTVILNIIIKDTGLGIPPEKIGMIFDYFTQADRTIPANYGGTGLGLAITRELVEMMGGAIKVESTPGKGSIFMLDIPFRISEELNKNVENEDLIIKRTDNGLKNKGYSILVADDDPTNLKLVMTILKKQGHNVCTAVNGEEVLNLLSKQDFDAAIIDIEMPVIDGIETAKRIRTGGAGKEKAAIPIIGLTAYSYNDIAARCVNSGIERIISKPVRTGFLNNTIIEIIEFDKINKRCKIKDQSDDGV